MRQRMIAILDRLKAKGKEGLTGSIIEYKGSAADMFELQTDLAEHRTWLKYETTGNGEVLRIELRHFFGHLDLSKASDPARFLLEMFQQNVPSFRSSGACLGLQPGDPFPLVCLNETHQFITTMSNETISEILSIAIFDLKMGLSFTFPPPVILWE